jgi:Kef-type K+ transport system membrane component KefB
MHQIGLLLLMFCSGLEIRTHFRAAERRTAIAVTVAGTLVSFLFSVPLLLFVDIDRYIGSAGSTVGFGIVFAVAIAVTSIPVISRILMDLKLTATPFARVVLSSAVAEDILLYVLLSLALSLGAARPPEVIDLPGLLGLAHGSAAYTLFHLLATVAFLTVVLRYGPRGLRWLDGMRYHWPRRSSPIASMLLSLLFITGFGLMLGVAPMLGAFAAGAAVGRRHSEIDPASPSDDQAKESIRTFSFAFFVPLYFAIVGLRLDLIRAFDPLFFVFFLLAACTVKMGGVYLGARAAGESNAMSSNLAVAMNARGGPGIVLASLALDAGLIHERFYSTLVMLSIVTSYMAGAWLARDKAVRFLTLDLPTKKGRA